MSASTCRRHGCDQPAPPRLYQAIEEFNAGAYFTCHETLEDLWLEETGPVRDLYRGILQIAAALLHLERGNLAGAVSLLAKSAVRLRPFPPTCREVRVADLCRDADRLREELTALAGGNGEQEYRQSLPMVRITAGADSGAGE